MGEATLCRFCEVTIELVAGRTELWVDADSRSPYCRPRVTGFVAQLHEPLALTTKGGGAISAD